MLIAWGLKRHYADARADDLWWILSPTARLVGVMTGATVHAAVREGYFSRERLFLIEKSCAGINFMIAAFGMLVFALFHRVSSATSAARVGCEPGGQLCGGSDGQRCADRDRDVARRSSCCAPGVQRRRCPPVRRHRRVFRQPGAAYELVRRLDCQVAAGFRHELASETRSRVPSHGSAASFYYAVTVALPLANGAAQSGAAFTEHALVVLLVPLVVIVFACAVHTICVWGGSGPLSGLAGRVGVC